MSSIRYRPDALIRRIRALLQSGLAAQVTAINADLAAEALTWRIPAVPASFIRIGAQGGELPEHVLAASGSSPLVKIVALPASVTPDSANAIGRRLGQVEVSAFLRFDQIVDGSGDPLSGTPAADTEPEETVVQCGLALREAVRLALSQPAALASVGIDAALIFRESYQIQDFDEGSGEILAIRAALTFEAKGRMKYL